MSQDPGDFLAMVAGMRQAVTVVAAAMNEGVAVPTEQGWTEEQAREVVAAAVASSLRAAGKGDDEQGEQG